MALATEQLQAIHQEISKTFADDPRIKVAAVAGTPPDKYEVTYHIEGLQKHESGTIEKAGSHTIVLSIPFGYPHFPPSCKPKSPIFHPDFDPAAICIGDFWDKNRSIAELIKHIGEMISGTFYSTSNAFNEEAAQWYADNLTGKEAKKSGTAGAEVAPPVDSILGPDEETELLSLLDEDEDEVDVDLTEPFTPSAADSIEPALSFLDEPESAAPDDASASLGDIFQESDFDFEAAPIREQAREKVDPSGNEELLPQGFASELSGELDEDQVDLEHLHELAAQNRFFGLDKELSLLSTATVFDGREALAEQAAEALERAQSLYTKALELEHKGAPAEALKCFQKIQTFTTDYPGLDDDISRMTQALELLGDWTEGGAGTPVKKKAKEAARPRKATAEPAPQPEPKPRSPGERGFFDDEPGRKSRLVPYSIALVVILVGAAIGVNYYFSSSQYERSRERYGLCQQSIDKGQFSDAELQCEAALGLARQIKLFKASARDALVMEIDKTLRSEPLKQGLAGNLALDGAYYPRQVVQNITSFREFKRQGDRLFGDGQWPQSVSSYEEALKIGTGEKAIDRQELFEISENIKIARMNIAYQSGIALIERKQWVLASKDLGDALEQLKGLSLPDKAARIDDITARLERIKQATEKEKGDLAFAESRWTEASAHYRNALALAQQSPAPDEQGLNELKQLVVKGELYAIIAAGKTAFREARWDEAISSYDRAITLLEDNRDLLAQDNTEENRRKLARIVLHASLIRDRQAAARHLKENRYDEAVAKLGAIIGSIDASEFSGEPEFQASREEAQQSIVQAEADQMMSDKIAYLEKNFEELFTRHYAGSPPEALVERTVVFDKKMGSQLLFRLQCVEVGRGRPLQLVMKYAYNLETGTWRFYSDSQ